MPNSLGKPRVDDRCVFNGIIFFNHNGLRWRGAPVAYGPCRTLNSRRKRRCKRQNRNEIMSDRLKSWRRMATRFDRCPKVLLAASARGNRHLLVWYHEANKAWVSTAYVGLICKNSRRRRLRNLMGIRSTSHTKTAARIIELKESDCASLFRTDWDSPLRLEFAFDRSFQDRGQ
ncbi:hypothetical protein [Ruegeria sp. SCSIO 43209]|uniref:hypothetical protein n=1 Tax=Ruegeria sp. SCSIO 43209 TaxID=2793010 RepID=UPI00351CDF2C